MKTNELSNGKLIGDVKVTRVENDVVFYSKKIWQGDWKRSIRFRMQIELFAKMYPRNMQPA